MSSTDRIYIPYGCGLGRLGQANVTGSHLAACQCGVIPRSHMCIASSSGGAWRIAASVRCGGGGRAAVYAAASGQQLRVGRRRGRRHSARRAGVFVRVCVCADLCAVRRSAADQLEISNVLQCILCCEERSASSQLLEYTHLPRHLLACRLSQHGISQAIHEPPDPLLPSKRLHSQCHVKERKIYARLQACVKGALSQ